MILIDRGLELHSCSSATFALPEIIVSWKLLRRLCSVSSLFIRFSVRSCTKYSSLAQSVEHLTVNQVVAGSSPAGGAKQRPHRKVWFFVSISKNWYGIATLYAVYDICRFAVVWYTRLGRDLFELLPHLCCIRCILYRTIDHTATV